MNEQESELFGHIHIGKVIISLDDEKLYYRE
jgi:hypothetical protein